MKLYTRSWQLHNLFYRTSPWVIYSIIKYKLHLILFIRERSWIFHLVGCHCTWQSWRQKYCLGELLLLIWLLLILELLIAVRLPNCCYWQLELHQPYYCCRIYHQEHCYHETNWNYLHLLVDGEPQLRWCLTNALIRPLWRLVLSWIELIKL